MDHARWKIAAANIDQWRGEKLKDTLRDYRDQVKRAQHMADALYGEIGKAIKLGEKAEDLYARVDPEAAYDLYGTHASDVRETANTVSQELLRIEKLVEKDPHF